MMAPTSGRDDGDWVVDVKHVKLRATYQEYADLWNEMSSQVNVHSGNYHLAYRLGDDHSEIVCRFLCFYYYQSSECIENMLLYETMHFQIVFFGSSAVWVAVCCCFFTWLNEILFLCTSCSSCWFFSLVFFDLEIAMHWWIVLLHQYRSKNCVYKLCS